MNGHASLGAVAQQLHGGRTILRAARVNGKFITLASWIAFLLSAVAEYGLEIDFPLTPALWLVIAGCSIVATTTHAAIGSRIHGSGKREASIYFSSDVPSLSGSASFSDNANSCRQAAPVGNCRATAPVATGSEDGISASGALALQILFRLTASDAIPAVIFLGPAGTRGPPGASDNHPPIPTPQLCTTSRASPFAVESAVKENHT